MLSKSRLIDNFVDMVKIDSPSMKEINMANWLIEYLEKRGINVIIDDAGKKFGGNSGNVIAYIKGKSNQEPICFAAHMDQVQPCISVNPIIERNIIKTDGNTTLGGDDKAGIAVILEAVESILEDDIPHRDIYLLFTVSEEFELLGAKNFDSKNLPCKNVVILDAGGPTGIIAYKAPAQESIEVKFYGRKAHAGIEPEKGLNAILVASNAISSMNIGRLDEFTTSNIGRIEGGGATNIVTDEVTFTAEIRSHIPNRLKEEINYMKKCCDIAANKFNTTYEFKHKNSYPSFELSKDSYIFKLSEYAIKKVGLEPNPMVIGGGSDANIIANLGYECAILSLGIYQVHTVNEYVNIDELYSATEIVYNMMIV